MSLIIRDALLETFLSIFWGFYQHTDTPSKLSLRVVGTGLNLLEIGEEFCDISDLLESSSHVYFSEAGLQYCYFESI